MLKTNSPHLHLTPLLGYPEIHSYLEETFWVLCLQQCGLHRLQLSTVAVVLQFQYLRLKNVI